MNILVLNAGSSSLKFQIIATDLDRIRQDKDVRLLRGEVERIGAEAVVTVQKGDGAKQTLTASLKNMSNALDFIVRWAASPESGVSEIQSVADIHAVGHRVVHGGEHFTDSVLINDEVLNGIESCIDLAPLHNPTNLSGIRAMRELLGPQIPQVAVFDTAFHHSLDERSYLYAIPYHLYLRYRIRRYGFHGISHRYMAYRYRTIRNLPR
jgi:acetate kinase